VSGSVVRESSRQTQTACAGCHWHEKAGEGSISGEVADIQSLCVPLAQSKLSRSARFQIIETNSIITAVPATYVARENIYHIDHRLQAYMKRK